MSDQATAEHQAGDLVTIAIAKEAMTFSAAHFTLFSETERENLHGHNWRVACEITASIGDSGLCFDYNLVKRQLRTLVDELDEKMLLPGASPWLRIEQDGTWIIACYANERIPFLPRDVLVVNIRNISVEELAGWFLHRLLAEPALRSQTIHTLRVGVSSGTNQWGWREQRIT